MTPPQHAALFKALSNPRRVRILTLLLGSDAGMSSGYISNKLDIPPGPTSHNLQLLHKVGLVRSQKSGRVVYYHPCREKASDLADVLLTEPPQEDDND